MKRKTKKQYEAKLNVESTAANGVNSQCRWSKKHPFVVQTNGKYGTWLRRNDPVRFDVGYQEWSRL